MKYKYTIFNHLDQKPIYDYAEYDGINTIKVYFDNRYDFLNALKSINFIKSNYLNLFKEHELKKILLREICKNKLVDEIYNYCKNINKKLYKDNFKHSTSINLNNVNTEKIILDSILSLFYKKNNSNHIMSNINKLIQRYEVSKKLYENYDVNLKKGFGNWKFIDNYIHFSILLSLQLLKNFNLQTLSTLLKVNDLIISLDKVKLNKNHLLIFVIIPICLEIKFVSTIVAQKGISFDT